VRHLQQPLPALQRARLRTRGTQRRKPPRRARTHARVDLQRRRAHPPGRVLRRTGPAFEDGLAGHSPASANRQAAIATILQRRV
jgi:hypothetical protein